jgi:hypothetical protein
MPQTLSEPIAILSHKAKRDREWLEDEFFDKPATRANLIYVSEHYEDIAANNTVCTDQDRVEWRRRSKLLKRLAAGLQNK